MSTILVITNFSLSSTNALDYACAFLHNNETKVVLLNVFTFSSGYAGDGVSIAALNEASEENENLLNSEYKRIKEIFPSLNLETKMVTGNFIDCIQEQIEEYNSPIIIIGAEGDYNSLMSWDENIIDAFIDLSVPVLIVPSHVKYNKITDVAFACNYKRKDLQQPLAMLKKLVTFTKAKLHIVHAKIKDEVLSLEEEENKTMLANTLSGIVPSFYELVNKDIVHAVDEFISEKNISMLIIMPNRTGTWQHIFSKSHTKALVYMNRIPVLALRNKTDFNI